MALRPRVREMYAEGRPLAEHLYLDGGRFVTWLEGRVEFPTTRNLVDTIRHMQQRGCVSVYSADRVLLALGLHLSDVPESIFMDRPDPRVSDPAVWEAKRQKAVRLYRDGVGPREIGRQIGANEKTISNWIRRAGIPRQRPDLAPKGAK